MTLDEFLAHEDYDKDVRKRCETDWKYEAVSPAGVCKVSTNDGSDAVTAQVSESRFWNGAHNSVMNIPDAADQRKGRVVPRDLSQRSSVIR